MENTSGAANRNPLRGGVCEAALTVEHCQNDVRPDEFARGRRKRPSAVGLLSTAARTVT